MWTRTDVELFVTKRERKCKVSLARGDRVRQTVKGGRVRRHGRNVLTGQMQTPVRAGKCAEWTAHEAEDGIQMDGVTCAVVEVVHRLYNMHVRCDKP